MLIADIGLDELFSLLPFGFLHVKKPVFAWQFLFQKFVFSKFGLCVQSGIVKINPHNCFT